ncbi:hypothetical protein KIW84_050915 [Lathyrus oleraceus]|uniref:Uncharacterized protein n=1 Tax=Pisum sativum TaxID=3888 RepID=A0A9D4WN34_PEA|nr:hypothetical protein KIW84_050915 [Pisum sativum]
MAPQKAVLNQKNVLLDVKIDAQKHITKSHVCTIVTIVVPSACVCLQELMETKKYVHAIMTGRIEMEDPNVLEHWFYQIAFSSCTIP